MLFDARGNPIPVYIDSQKDHRTPQMKRFDESFRQAMEGGGNHEFPSELIAKIKRAMETRDRLAPIMKALEENKKSGIDELADNVLEESRRQKKAQVITIPAKVNNELKAG